MSEHLEAENAIADFLGAAQCMLYSYGACTVSSVIGAVVGRHDVLVVDEQCGRNIRTGSN